RNVIGVGQKANVKHQVAFAGQTVTEAEAVHLDQNLACVAMKSRANGFAQLVHIELGGVDDRIRETPYRLQLRALALDAVRDALAHAQRMRAPCCAETA